MSVEAVVRITQYGGKESSFSTEELAPYLTIDVNASDSAGVLTGTRSFTHLKDVQNPRPVHGAESTFYATDDPETWSDSPTLAPSLLDSKRFSYGRFGSRYGNLDDYVGVVISCKDFSFSGDYNTQEKDFSGERPIKHLSNEVSSTVYSRDEARIEGTVDVSQVIFSSLASPVPYSYHNAITSNVSVRLSNYTYPLNSGTATLYLNGEEKELEVTPFYVGAGGFDAIWYNDQVFDYDSQINVEWVFYDTAATPNRIELGYWFRTVEDLMGPRISNIVPSDNSVDVPVSQCISFDLRDYEYNVNLDTLELYVNNQEVLFSDLVVTTLSSGDGYSIRYCPQEDFIYGDEVAVSIYVEDLATTPNYLFHVFTFTTVSSSPPVVVDLDPKPCRKYIPTDKDVEVFIVDGGQGLSDDIVFAVDDKIVVDIRKLPVVYRED